MFHPSINFQPLLSSGYESFKNLRYWCHPCILNTKGIRHAAELTRKAVNTISAINKVECDIRLDRQGEVIAVSGLDLVSEDLYDFARAAELIAIVETLLGTASISIHVKYLNRTDALINEGRWCQDHATNKSHFDDLALSICIPIVEGHTATTVNQYTLMPFENYFPHKTGNFTETAWSLEDKYIEPQATSTVPFGGAVIHSSLAIYRPAIDCIVRKLLVLNYRRSSYRQELRELKK
ncbi:hypothetical protein HNR39_001693 [Glaciimonas immobilis]|uniref:Uncharacterized protein n=1 Tax=Glaciimonas immobilis TaxID=728004 RepID=A0A840RTE0_9BURK|nr:hypothetical protein [Glaciimonas immobilis]